MTQTKQFPATVTIPTPMHTPLLRGAQARGPHALGPLGANMRIRVSRVDNDLITQVATDLGMKRAEYIRWCAVEVAKVLTSKEWPKWVLVNPEDDDN